MAEDVNKMQNKFYSSSIALLLNKFLNSNLALALISIIVVLFWALNLGYITICLLAVFVILTFVFCPNDPKPILLPVLAMSLMFSSIDRGLGVIIVCVSCAVASLIWFLVNKIFIQKTEITKGKLFWPYVLVIVANALAGVLVNFEIKAFAITLGLGLLLYFLYWFALNFITDYKKYLAYCFIFLSIIVIMQVVIAYCRFEDLLLAFKSKAIRIGIGEINAPALFVVSGIISSLYLATQQDKNKNKLLYILLTLFLDLGLVFTFSRISILVAIIANIIYFIFLVKKINNKKPVLIAGAVVLGLVVLSCIIFFDKISNIFSFIITQGLNGREDLWAWCFKLFKQNPIFGSGFITRDIASTAGSTLPLAGNGSYVQIMAHNTILHYLTCTGIVGLILNIPFYIKKYKILCSKINPFKIFCLINILCIEVVSLLDTAGTHNLFNMILVYIVIALAEKDTLEKKLKDDIKTEENIQQSQNIKQKQANTSL